MYIFHPILLAIVVYAVWYQKILLYYAMYLNNN